MYFKILVLQKFSSPGLRFSESRTLFIAAFVTGIKQDKLILTGTGCAIMHKKSEEHRTPS